jgi:hypothetical protein
MRKVERAAKCLAMRLQGFSLKDIGTAQDPPICPQRVHQIVSKALDDVIVENVEQLRKMEQLRLDEVQAVFYERALNGDARALDKVLAIMQRRARLLGLDVQPNATLNSRRHGNGPYEIDPKTGQPIVRIIVENDPEADLEEHKVSDEFWAQGRPLEVGSRPPSSPPDEETKH